MAQEPITGPLAPVPQSVTGVSVNVTVHDLTLLLGQMRTILNANGFPSGFQKIEWTAAYSMPPSIAVQLRDSLNLAIKQYVDTFGKILQDPNQKLEVLESGQKKK